jgi:hypothetical protein
MSVGNAPRLWVCGECTYEHSLAEEMCFLACSMCGTPRPNVVTTSTAVGNVAHRTSKSTAQKVHITGWLGGTVAATARRDHGDGAFGSPSKLDTSMATAAAAAAAAAAASPTIDTSATAGATATAASHTLTTSTAAATPGATAASPTLELAASQPSPSSSHVVSTTADGAAVTAVTANAGSPDDIDGHQSKRRRTFAELLRPRRSGDFVPRAKYVEPMIAQACVHACNTNMRVNSVARDKCVESMIAHTSTITHSDVGADIHVHPRPSRTMLARTSCCHLRRVVSKQSGALCSFC